MAALGVVLRSKSKSSSRCNQYGTFALLRLLIATTVSAVAQEQLPAAAALNDQANTTNKLRFDVASVRPSSESLAFRGVDFLNPAGDMTPPKGGLFSWNIQLPWLINFAYDLRNSQMRREARLALPKWAQEDWFAINARAEGDPTREQVRQMVRSLLEDRFQFAAHVAKSEGQVYALVVAKPGLGLKQHPEGAPCTLSQTLIDQYPNINPSYKAVPPHCGVFNRVLNHGDEYRFEMLDVTMQQVADTLGLGLPMLVLDKTGLTGRYDAVFGFAVDQLPPNADTSEDEIGLPPIPVALEKQLGLKLVKQNATVDKFVIDHIERLSEN
jgi:uncharacterized protein (TIGR03435 family)